MLSKRLYHRIVGLAILCRFAHGDAILVLRDFGEFGVGRLGLDRNGNSSAHDQLRAGSADHQFFAEISLPRLLLHELK